ncbi:OmpA family protein [Pontibacter sp. CAU 1760]
MNHLAKSFTRLSMLLVLFCLVATTAMAQSMRDANKMFNKENYREAIPQYEAVLAKDPDNAKALFRAGVSYMTFDKEKAADYLYRAHQLKPNVDKELQYWLGRADLINYRFDSAIEHFQAYQKEIPRRNEERRQEVAQLIQQSRVAKRETANPKDVFVKNLGGQINTNYSEHSPVISSDYNYLLFTSRSEAVTGGQEARDGEFFEDIFEAKRISEDEWEKPRVVPGALNSVGHDASIQLFDNDTKLLLYQSINNGDIMVSQRQADGSWGAPVSISENVNTKGFESDAYITPDGKTLFFSTNNYSENGDLDLYRVQRNRNGSWGKPQSLGSTINTPFDDDSPYLAADGTLYFASRGHAGMGGYDIFSAKYDSVARRWARPVNLGSPINTPDDDTYYRLAPDGSYAYLSSYRIGGYGEKDIYTINYIKTTGLKGQVFAKADSIPVTGVELIFNGLQADKRPIAYRDVTKGDSATYNVQVLSGRKYQVQLSRDNKVIETQEIDVPVVLSASADIKQDFYITLDSAAVLAVTSGSGSGTGTGTGTGASSSYTMQPVYYDLDEATLRPASIQELDNIARIMNANPNINISIEGHTDSRASNSYNMQLGQRRADVAYEYLVNKGISPKRLVTVTYGERRPVAPNTSEENMQLNRRTEFKVLPRQDDPQRN